MPSLRWILSCRLAPDKRRDLGNGWHNGPERELLWEKYGNDIFKYFKENRTVEDEDVSHFQELGMSCFVRTEQKLMRQYRTRPYHAAAKALLVSFATSIITYGADELSRHELNLLLVSLDFEGSEEKLGVKEFGVATFDTNSMFSTSGPMKIDAANFCSRAHNKRFVFGRTTRTSTELFPEIVADILRDLAKTHASHKILLVGHSVQFDIETLDKMGVMLEDLPVTGLIDTCKLAQEVDGHKGNLGKLLSHLNIPFARASLHCSGNDAHYTVQALLALLQRQHQLASDRLDELIHRPPPVLCLDEKHKTEDDEVGLADGAFDLFVDASGPEKTSLSQWLERRSDWQPDQRRR